jgi:hypothetical protein
MLLQPINQFIDFACLVALLATNHRDSQISHIGRSCFGGSPAGPRQERSGGEGFQHPVRKVPEKREFLLQIDIDAAEEDGGAGALVGFVESERQIKRDHQGLVTRLAQGRYQDVIAKTTAAVHAARAGCDLHYVHRARVG